MSIRILTQNGVDNTNIDGARSYHFASGQRSGIIKGALNEGNLYSASSNVIALDTCELLVSGHRVVIDSAQSVSLNNNPITPTRYSLVAQIIVNSSSVPAFTLLVQPTTTQLIQNNLFSTTTGNGTYQIELGKFTLNPNGTIDDIVRTADLITGGLGDDSSGEINIGTVTTTTLAAGLSAEVDVEQRYDSTQHKTFTDFTFSIPQGANGSVDTVFSYDSTTHTLTITNSD